MAGLDARREAEVAVRRGLDAVGDIASRIAQVTGEEPPEAWRAAPGELPDWIDARLVVVEAEHAAAEGRRALAADGREAAGAAHAAATGLAGRRERHAEASAELARREDAAERRQAVERQLEQARRAAPAAALAAQAAAAEAELAEIRRAAEAALQAAGVEAAPPAVQLTLEAESCAPEPALDAGAARESAGEHRRAAVLARDCAADEARLPILAAELERRKRQSAELSARAEAETSWLTGAEGERDRRRTAVQSARAAAAEAPGAQAAAERAAERARAAVERDGLAARAAAQHAEVDAARVTELDARQVWLAARERRLEGIAAELAGDLRDGEPCRVCGAVSHPAPAATADGGGLTAEQEQALGEQAEAAAAAHAAVRAELAGTEQALSGARALAGEVAADALATAAGQAAAVAERASAGGAAVPAAERALAAHTAEIERREAARAAAREASAGLASEIDAAARELAAAQERVTAARDGFATIDARVAWLEARIGAYERAAEGLDRLEHARGEHARRRQAAREAALLAGFASAEQALDAALDPAETARLETAVAQHDEALVRLRGIVAEPELVAASAAPAPDLAASAAALSAADAELEAAASQLALAGRRARELHELADELAGRLAAVAPALERRALVCSVAELADGSSAANRLRMPLSAYVLTARLEQIAQVASARLDRMSGGRYALQHCDERVGRSRKGGLGLEVLDAWTGRERPPSSLSGGETFQASLALALGLADVVAAEAGGARLETLFVDEGFGTLGDRALDDVLDVLDGLREGGRAVGVISHVSELRQRIPVQLHVEKGRAGSRVRQR